MDRYDDLLLKARAEMLGKDNLRKAPTKDTLFNMVWDRVVKAPEFDNEMYQQMRRENAQARFDQQTTDAKAQGWTDPFGQMNHGADLEGAPRPEAPPQGMRANFQAGREQTRDTSKPGMMGKVGGWLKDKFSRKPTEAAEGAPPTLQEEPPMSADDRRHAEIDRFIDSKGGGGRPRDTGGPSTSAGTQMPPNMEEIYRRVNSGELDGDYTPKPTPTQNTKPNMGMSIVESYIRTWGREPDAQWVRMNAPDEYEDWMASKNPPAEEAPMPPSGPPSGTPSQGGYQESSPEYRPQFEMPTEEAKEARNRRVAAYGGDPAPPPKGSPKMKTADEETAEQVAANTRAAKAGKQGNIFSNEGQAKRTVDMSASKRKERADAAKEAPAKEEAPKSNRKALAAERSAKRKDAKKKRQ
jgi:hypothetical protein